jgi:primosomal replication protein N
VTGNQIELEGRLLDQPEVRITPAGTPVLRFTVECGAPGEELRLGILMTGEAAIAAKQLLEPGRQVQVKVIGRMRALKGSLKTVGALEVVAESIEQVK